MEQENTNASLYNEVKIIDDAKQYFLKEFASSEIHLDQAYLHIGVYLGWIIENSLYSEDFEDEFGVQIFRFKNRDLSCVIVGELWDGIISSDQFSMPEGNAFTTYYYESGMYMKDFHQTLGGDNEESIFKVQDNWENFEKVQSIINERYAYWKMNIWDN
ncbi:hypothetical protein V6R21_15995 [Limibacter armeniacum]|uniref:DUF7832 domain-containing protein n=1 Tax=Limibacter armeniacum TaxID=466084 RepID=UPI002FE66C62